MYEPFGITKKAKLGSASWEEKHWFYFVPKTRWTTQHFISRTLAQKAKKENYLMWYEAEIPCTKCQHI